MNALTITGLTSPKVSVDELSLQARTEAIEEARLVVSVKNDFAAEVAGVSLQELKRLISVCEKSRVDIKAPVLVLSRDIDAAAKTFSTELETESKRIERLVGDYLNQKRLAAEAVERARLAEIAKIEEEQRRVADIARRKAEAELAAAANARQAEIIRARQAEEAARAEQAKNRAVAAVPFVPVTPPKIEGVTLRLVWKHSITDVVALYKARSDLVLLTGRTESINKAIAEAGADPKIPGLSVWSENSTRVRA